MNVQNVFAVAFGVFMIILGLIVIFFGNKEIPVRGGMFLGVFSKRPRLDDDSLPEWSYRFLFGGAAMFGGVLVILKIVKLA